MSATVEIKCNPNKPEARYFAVDGIEPTIRADQVFILKSINDAAEIGCELAMTLFQTRKPAEIKLYPFNGQDRIAISFDNPAEWDRSLGKQSNHTVEREVHNFIKSSLITFRKSLISLVEQDSPENTGDLTILQQMEVHLQRVKPDIVNEHGGSVRATNFDEDKGVLTIQFGKTCASACPASPYSTSLLIAPRMRNKFPEIKNVVFTNG